MRKAAIHVLAVCTAAAVISGCRGGDEPESTKETSKNAAPSSYVTPKGAIKDFSDVTCEKDGAGVWKGAGTLTNSTKKKQTYVVEFSVTNKKNSVLGAMEQEVAVAAGKSKDVAISSVYKSKASDGKVSCVDRVTLKQ